MTNGFFVRMSTLSQAALLTCVFLVACSVQERAMPTAKPLGNLAQAKAYWLAADTIAWDMPGAGSVSLHGNADATGITNGDSLPLAQAGIVDDSLADRFPHLAGLPVFRVQPEHLPRVPSILKTQFAVSARDSEGKLLDATGLQPAGVLDDLFSYDGPLGVTFENGIPLLRLWAPTARSVKLHLFDGPGPDMIASSVLPMNFDPANGTWYLAGEAGWDRMFYLFEVEVYVRRTKRFEQNLVTDPYSHGLSMDSRRSQVVNLDDTDLAPEGWVELQKPLFGKPEDIVLYELHVRDFSISDTTVPDHERGTFAAFRHNGTQGMRHLEGLAKAGLSHVHLLPAFDCATIPENPGDRLNTPDLSAFAPDSDRQQAEVDRVRARDAFNWCYDPFHYTVPEGSYSTEPDGVQRIIEFREMVANLNQNGLRVVMDVVYNHTTSAGQAENSVLDRIVPDYYQRLDAVGNVEMSTCCSNTATEHLMMEKLMVDSLLTWATAYKVDAFRFDLMGHHSKANIEKVRDALQALTVPEDGVDGRSIYLYGEGWDFGEVAGDARFVQATQKHMGGGTGVGTFNDRLRDAVRGGAHDDEGVTHLQTQGFVNGLFYAPNSENSGSKEERDRLLHFADLVRAGLAGSLAEFEFENRHGERVRASELDYEGQPAGYTSDPQEAINYVAAHDNETLFDINQYKLPRTTPMSDRVRVVNLANSIVALAQGIPFFHAGQDMLRSKSFDSNSFDSGDWFNLLDFSYQDNGWGRGLPPAWDNEANWPVAGPLLANPEMRPGSLDIWLARKHLEEMLKIRKSIDLFRLASAEDVNRRLSFHNTGPDQVPGLIVMQVRGEEGESVVVLFNVTTEPQVVALEGASGYELHPFQQLSSDPVVRQSLFDPSASTFTVLARTTAVFVAWGDADE